MDHIPDRSIGDLIRIMDTTTARERGIENVRGKITHKSWAGYTIQTEDGDTLEGVNPAIIAGV